MRSKKNVVVIEDDPVFSKLIESYLGRLELSLDFYHYASIEQANEEMHHNSPDLLFVDNGLPGKNGIESIALLKEFTPNIIVISGDSQVDNIGRALEAGAVDYYYKNALIMENIKEAVYKLF